MKNRMTHWLFTLLSILTISSTLHAAETVTFFHHDALGSTIAATDENGDTLWTEEYTPYGNRIEQTGDGTNALWYTGKEEELGLNYSLARWYDPQVGRFLSIDPVNFHEGNLQSFNRYAYANNNPYKYVDPDGRIAETGWDVVNLAIGATSLASNIDSGNYLAATVDALGLAVDGAATALPFVPAGASAGIKAYRSGGDVSAGVAQADNAPDFIVSPGGTAFPVPKDATGPTPVVNPSGKQTGAAFTGGSGGTNGQVDTMRIMDPTPPRGNSPGYQNGYIKYENKSGQGVDPYSGQTLSNKDSHFAID